MNCASPIAWEALVAYWAADMSPSETDALDEHLMECASCTAASARVAAIRQAVRAMIPPLITREQCAQLRARGLAVVDNPMAPGERKIAVFRPGLDFLFHRLRGLELADVDRVRVTLRVEETGEVLLDDADAPFDRESGEVILACQRHFEAFPPNIVVEVRAHEPSGSERLATYTIPHVFERAGG
jgi:hypothetical protein